MPGLTVAITGDTKGLDKALDSSQGKVKGFGADIGGTALKAAALAGGVAVVGAAIIGMTNAAAEDRAEQQKLQKAIEAAGAATGDYAAQVDKAIEAGQELAFTDTETREAMQSLVTATGDVTKSTELLTTAQDVARFAGVDLATAADAIAKAEAGQDGALRKLIPGLAKGATATDTIAAASKAAAGQADLFAESSEGMAKKSGDAIGELGEEIGSAFLPALDAIMPALIPVIKSLGELIKAILPILIPLIKLLAQGLVFLAEHLVRVAGFLTDLVKWMQKAIGMAGDFLDAINPFKGIKLPSLPFLSSAPAGASPGSRSAGTRAASAQGGITINVQGALDPEGTARTVAKLLAQHGIRVGRVSALATAPGAL